MQPYPNFCRPVYYVGLRLVISGSAHRLGCERPNQGPRFSAMTPGILGQKDENPMHVDLTWCDFHIHVHHLPLSRMNLGIAQHIGNRLVLFRDMEMDEQGYSPGATMRLGNISKYCELLFSEGFVVSGEDTPYGP
ncbi:hypothetical protein Salat_1690600 [Sesamum alatum]|uniref:Uncharacterized protein n=1 Tax=Sesamum alatum TaxID=300844 RepID=A0AAE2CJZ3_9LAMI|nr:hypothetical protein Salat_1690600 [Sesamum alatum]